MNLTDMETCYKMFRTEIIQSIVLKENRFGFEPEVTITISKLRDIRIYEIGISYVLVQRELEDSGFKLSYNLSIKGCASRADFNGFFKA